MASSYTTIRCRCGTFLSAQKVPWGALIVFRRLWQVLEARLECRAPWGRACSLTELAMSGTLHMGRAPAPDCGTGVVVFCSTGSLVLLPLRWQTCHLNKRSPKWAPSRHQKGNEGYRSDVKITKHFLVKSLHSCTNPQTAQSIAEKMPIIQAHLKYY